DVKVVRLTESPPRYSSGRIIEQLAGPPREAPAARASAARRPRGACRTDTAAAPRCGRPPAGRHRRYHGPEASTDSGQPPARRAVRRALPGCSEETDVANAKLPALIVRLLKRAVTGWMDDRATLLAASLSFFTMLSLGPLLLITLCV